MSRNRSLHARARQRGALIHEARAAVNALSESRLQQLGEPAGLNADAVRADLLTYAEREPRRALTAFAKETKR